MSLSSTRFDVAIIGSGIAGSALGAVLARQGLRVVIFEATSHPRFAIGESMILETSETMRALAELYDVPELAYFSSENFFTRIGTSHGVKRHFSYLHHEPGVPHDRQRTLQAVIPRQPHGHELHLYRQDSDYFMMTTAVAYGATVLQNTPVADVTFDAEGVTVQTASGEGYTADFIVDAGGFRSILADRFALRDYDLQTHSRALFTHMVGVPDFHAVGASREAYGLPFSVAEGTLHHVFAGGWLWVIPFNNHARATNPLCSVGLMLDPRIHPPQPELTPEAEFRAFIARYPDIERQFASAQAVRPWTRTGRIQYSSKRVVGDRFALLGHAAGFIDPLFSKGLYVSMMSTCLLAHLLLEAKGTGDYSAAAFQPLEESTLAYIRSNDRLIANSYKAFGDYRLWSVYAILWLVGAYTELVKLSSVRVQARDRQEYHTQARCLKLVGGGFDEFDAVAARLDAIMEKVDLGDEAAVVAAAAEMQAILEGVAWLPKPFLEVLHGKNHLPENKLRPGLLQHDAGFLGQGAYRQHFFGSRSMPDVIQAFVREKWRYSERSIRRQQGHPPGLASR
jgi:FADH2 O2-dependent halogenase